MSDSVDDRRLELLESRGITGEDARLALLAIKRGIVGADSVRALTVLDRLGHFPEELRTEFRAYHYGQA